jgi:hypothetical protein
MSVNEVDEMLIASAQHQAVLSLSDGIFNMGRAISQALRHDRTAAAVRRWRVD